jgi:hypothetical protein
MPTITGSITFTVGNATPVETVTQDINPAPVVAGTTTNPAKTETSELRRLVYPTSSFAPIVYESNPDVYTNFDRGPLDKRPRAFATATLTDNKIMGWLGVSKDVAIEERWMGTAKESRMKLDFFLALKDYYENPPTNGTYIIWEPRDRTTKRYNIVIEALTLSLSGSAGSGAGDYEFNYLATRHGYVTGTVELRFRVISEVV